MSDFKKAVLFFGNKYRMAKALNVSYMRVQQWEKRQVPAIWAVKLEQATGGEITRAQIRPDLYGA